MRVMQAVVRRALKVAAHWPGNRKIGRALFPPLVSTFLSNDAAFQKLICLNLVACQNEFAGISQSAVSEGRQLARLNCSAGRRLLLS